MGLGGLSEEDRDWLHRYNQLAGAHPFGGPFLMVPLSGPFVDRALAECEVLEARADEVDRTISEHRSRISYYEGLIGIAEERAALLRVAAQEATNRRVPD